MLVKLTPNLIEYETQTQAQSIGVTMIFTFNLQSFDDLFYQLQKEFTLNILKQMLKSLKINLNKY
jgi:hypothetical protein